MGRARHLHELIARLVVALPDVTPADAERVRAAVAECGPDQRTSVQAVSAWVLALRDHAELGRAICRELDRTLADELDAQPTNPTGRELPPWEPDHEADAAEQRAEIVAGLAIVRDMLPDHEYAAALDSLPATGPVVDLAELAAPLTLAPGETAELLSQHRAPVALSREPVSIESAPPRWTSWAGAGLCATAAIGAAFWLGTTQGSAAHTEPAVAEPPKQALPMRDGEVATCAPDESGRTHVPSVRRTSAAAFVRDVDALIVREPSGNEWRDSVEPEHSAVTRPGSRVREVVGLEEFGLEVPLGGESRARVVVEVAD